MRLRTKAILAFLVLFPADALAQHISIDGRFSPAQTLLGPNYGIPARLGKQVGGNLFQSFGQFGLSNGESATFFGPRKINNVIGRVTGGNASSIDGKINSDIRGANLYLINPNGIVFGPSFYTSTADYLKMLDGAKFQTTNPDASTLSAAPPAAFGFVTPRPAAISINGSMFAVGVAERDHDHDHDHKEYSTVYGHVTTPPPGTLGIIAGPIAIKGANFSASGGTIHVAGAASTGEVPVDPRSNPTITNWRPPKTG
jgi:filamentous hemagglutinin family protein